MTREALEALIFRKYTVKADYPFTDDVETGVFRHADSGKWFGIAMRISAKRIGRETNEQTDVLNLKCAPEVIESLVGIERGVFPAYHMNKMHWLTVTLDDSCDDSLIEWLLDISFDLTKPTKKRRE